MEQHKKTFAQTTRYNDAVFTELVAPIELVDSKHRNYARLLGTTIPLHDGIAFTGRLSEVRTQLSNGMTQGAIDGYLRRLGDGYSKDLSDDVLLTNVRELPFLSSSSLELLYWNQALFHPSLVSKALVLLGCRVDIGGDPADDSTIVSLAKSVNRGYSRLCDTYDKELDVLGQLSFTDIPHTHLGMNNKAD